MKKVFFTLAVAILVFAAVARAQWQDVTYTLKGGFNAIYVHGDASHASLETHFASSPQVLEVWRWNPNPNPVQITSSSLVPSTNTAEWTSWVRGDSGSKLSQLNGQAAYLIKCSGACEVTIRQRVVPPRTTWVRNGANFLGFPTRLATAYPTFGSYFATFPAAIASNRIYRYEGGELGPGNPAQLFSASGERVDRNQAYWFEAAVVGDFVSPITITPSDPDGLDFEKTRDVMSVRVHNRTATNVVLTITPVDSLEAPAGQAGLPAPPSVAGPVPLRRRVFDAATGTYSSTPITAAYTETIPQQSVVDLSFAIDRTLMSANPALFYASLLRFTDGGNLQDITLPVTAIPASLAGLWIGDATVTEVEGRSPAQRYSCTVERTGLRSSRMESRATKVASGTLGPITLPPGGGPYSYQWKKDGKDLTGETGATLLLSGAQATEIGLDNTATKRAYPLRVLLHVDNSKMASLLQQVFHFRSIGPPSAEFLYVKEDKVPATSKPNTARHVAVHLPRLPAPIAATTPITLGGAPVSFTVPLSWTDRTNPFVHQYHPDHDNKNARFDASLPEGVESYTVTRVCKFTFLSAPPDPGTVGWGSAVIGGTYEETLTGLHRTPITVRGTFELRRASEVGSLTLN